MTATADTLNSDLYEHLVFCIQEGPRSGHWVMNGEWWNDCRAMTGVDGRPLLFSSFDLLAPETLFGRQVEIRDDGGPPHLEELT